jgi:pimeloyl-ACP methyl ester carboxylesterase
MGGYVTLAFARRHAGRLRGLILADTKADPDDETGKANRDKAIALAKASGSRAIIDQMMPNLVGRDTAASRPEVAEELRTIASAQTPAVVIDALIALRDRPDARPGLPAISVPTLVIVGEQDTLTPPAKSEAIARGVSGAKLVTIPGAGHVASMEAADKFNSAVLDFLKQLG